MCKPLWDMFKKIYLFLRQAFLYSISIFLAKETELSSPEKIKKILIVRLDRVGDLVLSTPAIKALREKFPQAEIIMTVKSSTKDLIKAMPWVDEVVEYLGTFKTGRILKQRNIDLAVDLLMDYPLRSAMLTFLSGAKYRLGSAVKGRGVFFNLKVLPDSKPKHMVEQALDLLKKIQIEAGDKNPELILNQEDKEFVERMLIGKGVAPEDLLIGIHPGGYFSTQRWLPERFASLADITIEKFNAKIVLISGPGEEELVSGILDLMVNDAVEISGLALNRLATLISKCNLLICNNSGPLHIATAVNTPTVSTMGPTNPGCWAPRGKKHIVIRRDLPCISCNSGVCRNHKCMDLITTADMLEAVQKQLEQIKKGKINR